MFWKDVNEIVESLEEVYMDEIIDDLRIEDLHGMIISLDNFDDNPDDVNDELLDEILNVWIDNKKQKEQIQKEQIP